MKVASRLLRSQFVLCVTIAALMVLTAGCGQGTMRSNSNPGPDPTPTPAIADPNNFVYVTVNSTSSVEGFMIDSTGTVAPIPGSPFAVPEGPVGITRTQDFLFVGSVGLVSQTPDKFMITTYRIDPGTGALTQVAQLHTRGMPFNLSVDPGGKFLYMPGVDVFSIAAGGQLSEIPGSPFGSPSALVFVGRFITFHPTGKFLYSIGSPVGHGDPTDTAIFASVDPQTGVPSNGQMLGPRTDGLAITPDGKFMVATNAEVGSQNQVCTYTIDPITGAPSSAALGGKPVTPFSCATVVTTSFLGMVTIDPSGSFAAITGETALFMFRLSNGIITPAGTTAVKAGIPPALISFSRDGKYLFAAGGDPSHVNLGNQVSVFHFNSTNGTLTPASGSPFVLKDTPWRMVQ